MKQGEIWVVMYPDGIGHEYFKERPAIIVEADGLVNKSVLVTVMPLSSQTDKKVRGDILIKKNSINSLHADSLIKVEHIQSFDRSRFLKKIGKVNDVNLKQVKNYLKKHFAIN